jgi:hypothetical protein
MRGVLWLVSDMAQHVTGGMAHGNYEGWVRDDPLKNGIQPCHHGILRPTNVRFVLRAETWPVRRESLEAVRAQNAKVPSRRVLRSTTSRAEEELDRTASDPSGQGAGKLGATHAHSNVSSAGGGSEEAVAWMQNR